MLTTCISMLYHRDLRQKHNNDANKSHNLFAILLLLLLFIIIIIFFYNNNNNNNILLYNVIIIIIIIIDSDDPVCYLCACLCWWTQVSWRTV